MKLVLLLLFIVVSPLISEDFKDLSKQSDKFLAQKNYEKALEYAQKSLDEVNKLYGENNKYQITQYGKIGRIYFYKGDYNNTVIWYEKQKDLIEKMIGKKNKKYARVLNNLSVVYKTLGKNSLVEPLYIESIDIYKEMIGNQDTSYAKTLSNLAMHYYGEGKYPEAEDYFKEALEIKIKKLGKNNFSTGITYLQFGMLYQMIGNNEKAENNLRNAVDVFEKTSGEANPNTIKATNQLALLYLDMGEKEKAKPLLAKGSKHVDNLLKQPSLENFQSLYNIIQLNINSKKDDVALDILNKLLPAMDFTIGNSHPLYSNCLQARGIVYFKKGKYQEAFNDLSQNVEIKKMLYDSTNVNYAKSVHQLAGILKEMKRFDEAEYYYKQAFDVYLLQIEKYFPYYSESEKSKFYKVLKENFEMYNNYVLSRVDDNPSLTKSMYDYHISTKGLLLDYSKGLKEAIKKTGNKSLKLKYDDWKLKKEQISKLFDKSNVELESQGINLKDIEAEVNELEKELSKSSKEFGEKDKKKVNWRDIQEVLKPNEAAIEIIRFKYFGHAWEDSTFYVALILTSETKDYPKIVVMDKGKEMDSKYLKGYKRAIKSKFPDKRSYGRYWEDINNELKGKDVLYISLDGVYNNINLNTLKNPDGNFVIDDKTIFTVTNTKEILEREKSISGNSLKFASLLGFPKYKLDGSDLAQDRNKLDLDKVKELDKNEIRISDLPGTKVEIELIDKMLKENGFTTDIYMGENASEGNFKKLKKSSIIHIATHGFFLSDLSGVEDERVFGVDVEKANQNPLLRSGLLFSGASNFINYDFTSQKSDENGIMTAYEAMNLSLDDSELVIMSACETGLGEIMNGEGVYGLQRSFRVAGAKNLIMSLWTVNDETTQELMILFYKNWLSGEEVHNAFKNAQLSLKEKYKEPYYWGAFMLTGVLPE